MGGHPAERHPTMAGIIAEKSRSNPVAEGLNSKNHTRNAEQGYMETGVSLLRRCNDSSAGFSILNGRNIGNPTGNSKNQRVAALTVAASAVEAGRMR